MTLTSARKASSGSDSRELYVARSRGAGCWQARRVGVPLPHPDLRGLVPCLVGELLRVCAVAEEEVGAPLRLPARVASVLDDDQAVVVGTPTEQDAARLGAVGGGASEIANAILDSGEQCRGGPHERQLGHPGRGGGAAPQFDFTGVLDVERGAIPGRGRNPMTAWSPASVWSR